jgi:hypothetical protein
MDKKNTPSDRALRSNHPRKKLRNRSATPKSNPEPSVTASKKVSPPKKKCQEKEHVFKTPSPLLLPNQKRRTLMPSKCYQCSKEKDEKELIYVFPTKSGNKKLCSVPCLTSFRTSWNNFQVNNYIFKSYWML